MDVYEVAIIGSGVSGLVSGYLLCQEHEVTIFEKDSRIGGHAHTLFVEKDRLKIPVDNGFMVFNPNRYPNFIGLIERLGVETIKTNMSLGVNIPGQIIYQGEIPLGAFTWPNIARPAYLRFLLEIVRFRKLARRALNNSEYQTENLGHFLDKNGFSHNLSEWFIRPMLSAIWSMKETDKVSDFPALATFTFLNNHRLLNTFQPTWMTIKGGSIEYVSRVQDHIVKNKGKIILNTTIKEVARSKSGVRITTQDNRYNFDYVVFATHADITKELISDMTKTEFSALSKFTYMPNTTVLHADQNLVPDKKYMLAAWNYLKPSKNSHAIFTYCMNILQHIDKKYPMLVTLNSTKETKIKNIYHTEEYAHPEYNLKVLEGQAEIAKIQGDNRTIFAGAYLGYGFHEDGVVSAVNAAKLLGVKAPWLS